MIQSIWVVLMATCMFVTTFFIGYLPTRFKTSQKVMNLIAIFGAGLLVGAAIIVILPEGMLILFQSLLNPEVQAGVIDPLEADVHGSVMIDPKVTNYVGLSLIFGFTVMLVLDQGFLIMQERHMHKLNH